jgi:hypothetical protein
MKRFPSKHGARVVFDPVRSKTPAPSSLRPRTIPRSAPLPREFTENEAPTKPRSPSYAEVDVVEANLKVDPRYEGE